jgi:hypothetical protein
MPSSAASAKVRQIRARMLANLEALSEGEGVEEAARR